MMHRRQQKIFGKYLAEARSNISDSDVPNGNDKAIYFETMQIYYAHRTSTTKEDSLRWNPEYWINGFFIPDFVPLLSCITKEDLKIAAECVAVCEILERRNPEIRNSDWSGTRNRLIAPPEFEKLLSSRSKG